MKRLFKLEQQIGRYGEQLLAKRTQQPSNKWVVDEMRTMLDRKMSAHSARPELTQHFSELFSGLEHINSPTQLARDPLDPQNTESQIMAAFDERYYRGVATFGFATRVLADRRVRDPQHLVRAVAQGGTILGAWTLLQRQLFSLHVANKLWVLGEREAARARLRTDYAQFWRARLSGATLGERDLRLLVRALANTRAVPLAELAEDLQHNWRSLYVLWQTAFGRLAAEADVAALDDPARLWPALNHIAAQFVSPRALPPALAFVPRTPAGAPDQIRHALLRHAEHARDEHLATLLVDDDAELKITLA